MIRTCLPSASSAKAIASCEPIESPSGRACEVSRKRGRARISSRIRAMSAAAAAGSLPSSPVAAASVVVFVLVIRCGCGWRFGRGLAARRVELMEDLLDAISALDGLVEEEFQLRHALQPQPAADLPPQERHCA